MIWMVITKKEMEDGANHVFRYNREALGKNCIDLKIVDEDDSLDFVMDDDIIVSRTQNRNLLYTIKKKGVKNTAECFELYSLVKDKSRLSEILSSNDILVPKQYGLSSLEEGKTYFVKPRYGCESFGIDEFSICHSIEYVESQINKLVSSGYECVIEDFIGGTDCTAACIMREGYESLCVYPIEVETNEVGNIQTHESKIKEYELCSHLTGKREEKMKEICRKIFDVLHMKHIARIDFRQAQDGRLFVIDINLLPGLGPTDHYAKCLLLSNNISYIDAMKALVESAS